MTKTSPLRGVLSASLTHAPLILMALLALASFALFKQAPTASERHVNASNSTQDDYFVQRFFASEFLPTGIAKSHLSGTNAQHNPSQKTLTIDNIDFIASSSSALYQGSAKTGTVSDDGKHITLVGRAVINKQGRTGSSPSVHFESDQITVRQDPDVVEASKEPQLKGRVRMVIEAR